MLMLLAEGLLPFHMTLIKRTIAGLKVALSGVDSTISETKYIIRSLSHAKTVRFPYTTTLSESTLTRLIWSPTT